MSMWKSNEKGFDITIELYKIVSIDFVADVKNCSCHFINKSKMWIVTICFTFIFQTVDFFISVKSLLSNSIYHSFSLFKLIGFFSFCSIKWLVLIWNFFCKQSLRLLSKNYTLLWSQLHWYSFCWSSPTISNSYLDKQNK